VADGELAMKSDRLPGMTNVVRFPVERRVRPTLDLLREIAPDVRELLSVADVFGLDVPVPDLRDRADAATAEYILIHLAGPARTLGALDALLDPVVARAVAACQAAHDLAAAATDAQRLHLSAQTAGDARTGKLQERAEALTLKSAEALIEAHARVEEAEGVARAVGMARCGEAWTPRNLRAEEAVLFGVVRSAG
jgi:hypothetical protein